MTYTPDTSDARVERLQRIGARDGGDPEPLSVPVRDLLEMVLAIRERDALLADYAEDLADYIGQGCGSSDGRTLDSMASSTWADGIRRLEQLGRVRVIEELSPRWIRAEWIVP